MNNSIKTDILAYLDLCKKYNETPHRTPDAYGNLVPDCYGAHGSLLRERVKQEHQSFSAPNSIQNSYVFKNDIGQEIHAGDSVIAITTYFGTKKIKVREGTFMGLSKSGNPQVWIIKESKIITLKCGRIYTIVKK